VANAPKPEPLPVVPAAEVPPEPERSGWLVEGLWSREAVGLIGGAPKCGKTWLALDLAVSVASGTPALGRFSVREPGPVLFYGAEDAPPQLRERLLALAAARDLRLDVLDLGLILCEGLRLDTEPDLARLAATLERHRPRLLILDPLVRLHRIDENSAGEMSALLGELRLLQRHYRLAIVLVHHLRKQGGADGQALRGSGDLHAWGDSNLFLRRRERHLVLRAEHRSAPAPEPCRLALASEPYPHLHLLETEEPGAEPTAELAERIVAALATAPRPLGREALRQELHTRNASLGDALARLRADGRIERQGDGFALAAVPVPTPSVAREREPERAPSTPPSPAARGPDFSGSS
jgi:hypothetical protein